MPLTADKPLSEYGVSDGTTLLFKDLGTQVSDLQRDCGSSTAMHALTLSDLATPAVSYVADSDPVLHCC